MRRLHCMLVKVVLDLVWNTEGSALLYYNKVRQTSRWKRATTISINQINNNNEETIYENDAPAMRPHCRQRNGVGRQLDMDGLF